MIWTHTFTYIHTHTYTYIHIYEYVYVHIYIYINIQKRLFSLTGHYKILNIVPCAIQWVLVDSLMYDIVYVLIPNF